MSIKKHTHELDRPVQDRDASAVATAAGPVMSNSGRAAYVQRKRAERAANGGAPGGADIHAAAQRGIAGPVVELPHRDRIQASFGRHDVSGIAAHVGGAARTAADSMGANAYATGSHVSFAEHPDLHTAAHEAAHVVQQRGGVQLSGGVGKAGDAYEQHADAVADKVVAGESAEALLDEHAGAGGAATTAVQRDAKPDLDSTRTEFIAHLDRAANTARNGVAFYKANPFGSGSSVLASAQAQTAEHLAAAGAIRESSRMNIIAGSSAADALLTAFLEARTLHDIAVVEC